MALIGLDKIAAQAAGFVAKVELGAAEDQRSYARQQGHEETSISLLLRSHPTACCTDRKPKFRVSCGSI